MCVGEAQYSYHTAEPQWVVPEILDLSPGARLFRGIPREAEAFLEPLGVYGLRPCARTGVILARLVGRVTNSVIC